MPYPPNLKSVGDSPCKKVLCKSVKSVGASSQQEGSVCSVKSVGASSQQEGSVCSVKSVGDCLSGCVGMAGMPYPPMLAEHFDSL